ncbi:hypothetical protein PSOLE_35690 [Pseudomonas oleovorans subsp. oleovorans]|uniref:Uncharacterized protein n=2 Tax=Ectopseudomonas oleovorans TaxID=301 RepID=A0A379PJH9_ECTOL|nr:hypothetical protein PSOLE_35690 [Pseudomonas oleovorans subsp. oleovorans]SEJ64259.1 hypothetical protein SAMN05216280_103348 [Pseudomonas oleovorans]SUE72436.1 Uncharacterised protein [Pseudomonas oleovorans]
MTDSMSAIVRVSREKVDEAIRAMASINSGNAHQIKVPQDDEPVYWQRREWVNWAVQVGKELAADVAKMNDLPSDTKHAEMAYLPVDAISLLKIWQIHLGSCRESCDESGKELWDRINAAIERAQPACAYQVQDVALSKGV